MRLTSLYMLGVFLLSRIFCGQAGVSIRVEVTLYPIFQGETVTLRCEIQGGGGTRWTYEWRSTNREPPTSREFRINNITESDNGEYRCRGRSDSNLTEWSDAFPLTVIPNKPSATLSAEGTIIPAGGSVTLSCSVQGFADWRFDWFRHDSAHSAQLNYHNEAGRVSVSEGGLYSCRGARGNPAFHTENSSEVSIIKTVSIKPAVVPQHAWPQIYRDESLILRCEIRGGGGTQWTYEWSPDNRNSPGSREYVIFHVSETHNRAYSCRATSDYLLTDWSNTFTLALLPADKPAATLAALRRVIPAGGSVTLTCSVTGSAGWTFDWLRCGSETCVKYGKSNGILKVSEGGLYSCKGRRGHPVFYTKESNRVAIERAANKARPITTAQETTTPSGSRATLTCNMDRSTDSLYDSFRCRSLPSEYQFIRKDQLDTVIVLAENDPYSCSVGRGNLLFYTKNGTEMHKFGFQATCWSFITPFVVGLVGGLLPTGLLLLSCCLKKIKAPCHHIVTQSLNTNPGSATQQSGVPNETQAYSSLVHRGVSIYECIQGNGDSGTGEPANEYINVVP